MKVKLMFLSCLVGASLIANEINSNSNIEEPLEKEVMETSYVKQEPMQDSVDKERIKQDSVDKERIKQDSVDKERIKQDSIDKETIDKPEIKNLFKKVNKSKEVAEFHKDKSLEDIIYKHECDINMLKDAVAKLILALSKGDNIKDELADVSKKILALEEENKKLKEQKPLIIEVNKILDTEDALKPKKEEECINEKVVKNYKIKDIKHSYIDITPEKTYSAQVNTLNVYKLPYLGSEKESFSLKKGEKFIGDKYTKAGWVHIKSGGWVRGYEIFPRVLEEKSKVEYKKVCK